MRIAVIGALFFILTGCGQPKDQTAALQQRIDSLQRELDNVYRPGLGEFMSGIQVHHAKLWFAGKAENWKLADFEVGEIREALDDVQKFCEDRPEINDLPMILPVVDSVSKAIGQENLSRFQGAFVLLTNTCNNCHQVTKHAFNVIRIPDAPPFTNQVFNKPNGSK